MRCLLCPPAHVPRARLTPGARSHQGELRLAARLAALYHNALVETNIGPPEPAAEEEPEDCVLSPAEDGAPAYGDEDFELNEELLPWNMKGIREEERWGL